VVRRAARSPATSRLRPRSTLPSSGVSEEDEGSGMRWRCFSAAARSAGEEEDGVVGGKFGVEGTEMLFLREAERETVRMEKRFGVGS